jgi:hypothetical protein
VLVAAGSDDPGADEVITMIGGGDSELVGN